MGIEIARTRSEGKLTITQTKYIEKMGETFLTSSTTKTFSTPVHTSRCDAFMKITTAATDIDRAKMKLKPYLSLMGSLLWATLTHPECAYYVAFLCQFMHDPSTDAWEAALGILCYLQQAKSLGITFEKDKSNLLAPFTDSSWGQSPLPFGGFVILFCGGAISWSARKLKIAPQSSAEAESAVYAACAKDLKFIIHLLQDLGITFKHPIIIYCDNTTAVSHILNVGATSRTKHYERWMHIGREQFLTKFSLPKWISTIHQVADIFTKALDKTTFLKFRAAILNLNFDHTPTLSEILS